MNTTPYNKSASRQGSSVHGQVIAPARGAACNNMDWHDYFTYNTEGGGLIWKARTVNASASNRLNSWNTKYAGKAAGPVKNPPYMDYHRINILMPGTKKRKTFQVHQIVWYLNHGPVPDGLVIDHIDRNTFNNRIENLRVCTRAQNNSNSSMRPHNTSGYRGVHRQCGKWVASIRVCGKRISLGRYDNIENAADAYRAAQQKYHGDFAGPRSAPS